MQKSDFSDLNFENIGTWPLPAKLILVGASFLVILILAFFLLIKPEMSRLHVTQDEEQIFLDSYATKAGQASNIDVYRQQLIVIKKMLNDVIQQLPKKSEIPNLIEDISKLGVASGLEFNLIKPAPEVDKGFYTELPIELSVTGDYHQLASFISSVANMPRIVTLDNFKITRLSADKTAANAGTPIKPMHEDDLKMDVTAKTYHYEGVKPNTGGNVSGQSG